MKNDASEFASTIVECNPEATDEYVAEFTAFVFLSPSRIFRIWVDAVLYKYLPRIYRLLP